MLKIFFLTLLMVVCLPFEGKTEPMDQKKIYLAESIPHQGPSPLDPSRRITNPPTPIAEPLKEAPLAPLPTNPVNPSPPPVSRNPSTETGTPFTVPPAPQPPINSAPSSPNPSTGSAVGTPPSRPVSPLVTPPPSR